MTREEQLQKRAEVLRQGHTDLLASPPNCACTSFAADAIAEDDRIAAEPVEEADPAPTWRPIAELPPEWRDGRLVLCQLSEGNWGDFDGFPVALKFEGSDWYDDIGTERDPVRYLTLAIPEPPRG